MTAPRTVVVTGASTGIGEAITRRLDRLGFRVVAGVRRSDDAARLAAAASDRLVTVTLDVTEPSQIAAAAARVGELVGDRGLAGLVNNAGIALGGPVEFVPIDLVRRQFEVNVFGMIAVTQAFLPYLRVARGRIVNMGSIAGKAVSPMVVPYGMSKHAVEAFTDGLRLELAGSGIESSVIEPGAVKTPIWDKGASLLAEAERTLPAAALARYGRTIRFFGKLMGYLNETGVSAERVADAVVDALESKTPKTRYLVGRDARLRALVVRFLPNRLADRLVLDRLAAMERRLG
ncbi:MAG: SDR family oxidoreductase [Gemmatimonadetes bacterium]|nr:SDR family oxidoreductase [Gemmatimonadota bacterium]